MFRHQKFLVMVLCLVGFSQAFALEGEYEAESQQAAPEESMQDKLDRFKAEKGRQLAKIKEREAQKAVQAKQDVKSAELKRWEDTRAQAKEEENQRVATINAMSRFERLKRVQLFRNKSNDTSPKSISLSEFFSKDSSKAITGVADEDAVNLKFYRKMKAEAIRSSAQEKSERANKDTEARDRKNEEKKLDDQAKKLKLNKAEKNKLTTDFKAGDIANFNTLHGTLTKKELGNVVVSLNNEDLGKMSTDNLSAIVRKFDDTKLTHMTRVTNEFKKWMKDNKGSATLARTMYRASLIGEVKEIQAQLKSKWF